jgi:hypothetical protein
MLMQRLGHVPGSIEHLFNRFGDGTGDRNMIHMGRRGAEVLSVVSYVKLKPQAADASKSDSRCVLRTVAAWAACC